MTLKSRTDLRGTIRILESPELPFVVLRIFTLSPGEQVLPRGGHAHIECWQLAIPNSGEVLFKGENISNSWEFSLEVGVGLVIPPMNWCTLQFDSKVASLTVLASHPYDEQDYILERP